MMTNSENFYQEFTKGDLMTQNNINNYLLKINPEHFDIDSGITLLMKNEMNLIVGATGSGKSKIGAYFKRQLILEECDPEFIRNIDFKKNRILVIDTEMDKARICIWYCQTPFYDLSNSKLEKLVDENKLIGKSLHGAGSEKEKIDIITNCVNEFKSNFPDDNLVVIIDSVFSLVENTNDPMNNKIANDLSNLLSNTTSIIISHTNKAQNSTSATGSLGTSLERYASIILNVSPSTNNSTDLIIKKTKANPNDHNIKINIKSKPVRIPCKSNTNNLEIEIYPLYQPSITNKNEKSDNVNLEDKCFELIKFYEKEYTNNKDEMLQKNIVIRLEKDTNKADKTIYKYLKKLKVDGKIKIDNNYIKTV